MWNPSFQVMDAVSPDRFALCLAEREYDDPFSVVIEYNSAFPQAWSRNDIPREIVALCYWARKGASDPVLMGLSNEGDVYTLSGQDVPVQKIPKTGVLSADADGRGQVWSITATPQALFVAGENAQLYRSTDGYEWTALHETTLGQMTGAATSLSFSEARGLGENDVLLVGSQQQSLAEAAKPLSDVLQDGMSIEDMMAAFEGIGKSSQASPPVGKVLRVGGETVEELFSQTDAHLNGLVVEEDGTIWAFGAFGLILKGDGTSPLSRVGFHGDTQTLLSASRFRGEMIFASDYALHRFDGHMFAPLKPKLDPIINDGVPTPLNVIGFDDVMLYADYKHGLCRWNGETWAWVTIPETLLRRNFPGLNR